MDCSMPGFPVHHQLPELIQTQVHRVGDAIQPSHPLSSLPLRPSNQDARSQTDNIKCWRRYGAARTILKCWWECEWVPKLWKVVWQYLLNIKHTYHDPASPCFHIQEHLVTLEGIRVYQVIALFPCFSFSIIFFQCSFRSSEVLPMNTHNFCLLWTISSLVTSSTLSYPSI